MNQEPYAPSVADAYAVKALLTGQARLPLDLAELVLDLAAYWPHTRTISTKTPCKAVGRQSEHVFLLRSKPLCVGAAEDYPRSEPVGDNSSASRENKRRRASAVFGDGGKGEDELPEPWSRHPARRVVFRLRSHDQGWSSEQGRGTYANSWTGFDAGVERYHPTALFDSIDKPNSFGKHDTELGNDDKQPATPFNEHTSADYLRAWQDQVPALSFKPVLPPTPLSTPNNEQSRSNEMESQSEKIQAHNPRPSSPRSRPEPEPTTGPRYAVPISEVWPRKEWHNHPRCVQRNVNARISTEDHVVVWSWDDDIPAGSERAKRELAEKGRGEETGDGSMVKKLMGGDCITLWAHAFFPGWKNHVYSAEVEVWFAV